MRTSSNLVISFISMYMFIFSHSKLSYTNISINWYFVILEQKTSPRQVLTRNEIISHFCIRKYFSSTCITTLTFVQLDKAYRPPSTQLKWYLLRRHMRCLSLSSQTLSKLSFPGLEYLEIFDLESSVIVSSQLRLRED